MTSTTTVSSAYSTGVSQPVGNYRDGQAAIGDLADAAATDTTSLWSVSALLKGCLVGLGLSSGTWETNAARRLYEDPSAAIGRRSDSAATSTSQASSVIGLLKGILATAGL